MKITLIGPVPPYRGGIAHFTQNLAENLLQNGYDVLTISYRKQYPKWLYPGKSEKDFSQEIKIKDARFLFSPLNYLDWKKTLQAIKNFESDLVVYQWWVTFWAPATAWLIQKLNRLGIPIRVLVHNAFPHEKGWLDKKLAKFALKDARYFVTMSEKESTRLKTVVNNDSEIEISAHPIYAQFPQSGLSKAEVREKLGLPMESKIALFFGFVRPYKGLGVLLEAMGMLKRENVDLHLVVAGEFWQDKADYLTQIDNLNISNMVTIHDEYIPDSEAGLFFEAADFFVAPYLDGTQSGSIKIAMGYHLPMVISDVIADDILKDRFGYCLVVPTGDVAALSRAIQKTITYDRDGYKNISYNQITWRDLIYALIIKNKSNAARL